MKWRKWFYGLPLLWKETIRRKQSEQELNDELAFHIEMQVESNRAKGMTPDESRQAALRRFDGLEQRKEECRDTRRGNWFAESIADLGYALRTLRQRPIFTAVAVCSLAIGIGVNATLFSIVDAVVLHPVPLADADRLVVIDEYKNGVRSNGNPSRTYDWGALTEGIESVTGYYSEDVVLTGDGEPVKVSALRTCGDPLRTFGIHPVLGRGFSADEQRGIGEPVLMITHSAWRQRFGGDAAILGRTLTLSGKPYTVVGILPSGLTYPPGGEIWAPIPRSSQDETSRGAAFLSAIARLAPSVNREQIQPRLDVVAAQLAKLYPATDAGRTARAIPIAGFETRDTKAPVLILWGTAMVVLLLACLNYTGLLFSRSLTRLRESSIRTALGASRARLIRLYVSESILLALIGGSIGLVAAALLVNVAIQELPASLPNLASISLNPRVLAATLGLSIFCGLVGGWVPALRTSSAAPEKCLRERASLPSRRSQWLQETLLAGQVALSVILLTGATLLTRSFIRITTESLGFRPENVLTVNIDLPWDTPHGRLSSISAQTLETLARIPGVSAVGMVDRLPLKGGTQGRSFGIRSQPLPSGKLSAETSLRAISGNYFAAVGTPILAGRDLKAYRDDGTHEVVVNASFATRYFGGKNVIGQAIQFEQSESERTKGTWWEIVGMAGNIRQDPTQDTPPEIYIAAEETYWPLQEYVLRSTVDTSRLTADVRHAIRQMDGSLVIDRIEALQETVAGAHAQPRLRAGVFSAFALVALVLTALGIYGLQAQTVVQRRKEIGLRMALGAVPMEASVSVLRKSLFVVLIGLAVGVLCATVLTDLLKSLLYGVSALDPFAFIAGAAILLLTCAAASYIPLHRAASVDPMIALRED